MKDEQLEQNVIDIFSHLYISISEPHMEGCHRLTKSKTTANFANRKVFKDVPEKKFEITQSLVLRGKTSCSLVIM